MSKTFVRGQKSKLSDIEVTDQCQVGISAHGSVGQSFDISCIGLDANDKLSDENYMIFYNQPSSPCGGLKVAATALGELQSFQIDLSRLPATIKKLVFIATVDGAGTMSSLSDGKLSVSSGGRERAQFCFSGSDFSKERAIMIADFYFKDVWRLSAVGQGFNGGLDALIKHFGGSVAEDAPPAGASTSAAGSANHAVQQGSLQSSGLSQAGSVQQNSAPASGTSGSQRAISLEKKLEKEAPRLLSLNKKAGVILEKKKLTDVRARVILVLDCSGSMTAQYTNRGAVQAVLDRVATLALRFDDDGELEVWFFADRCKQHENVTLRNLDGYISRVINTRGELVKGLGYANDEAGVIKALLDSLTGAPIRDPIYVVFITDGGIHRNEPIERAIRDASKLPLFWQFVGLGGSNYGVLENLDRLHGRVVDNANFFHVDDLARIEDSELYERLLNEFPTWLKEARQAGVLS